MIDSPTTEPRGGSALETEASKTGRSISCRLPKIVTLPNADVRLVSTDGHPVRGTRSLADGTISLPGLVEILPGTKLIVTAFDKDKTESQLIETLKV